MTAFIRQEALEKAREIQLKADEEFAIEKSKLVRSETSSIDSSYEKKFKQASMSQQITRSTSANKTRLKVLGARQSLLEDLFEKARDKIKNVASDEKKYQQILESLVLEGFYALNEPKLLVRCREKDKQLVEKAIKSAKKEYKSKLDRDIDAKIDESDPVPEDS